MTRSRSFGKSIAPFVGVVVLVATVVVLTVYAWRIGQASATTQRPDQQTIDRGRYLATIGGCNDCHTPFKMTDQGPMPDGSRLLSGHPEGMKLGPAPKMEGGWMWAGSATNTAFAGPWGMTYAANLTPDPDTGLGHWTEAMFMSAMRTGKHQGNPGGRSILPPMPWMAMSQMTDADLKAMWAYLQSISAMKNHVPEYQPPSEK